MKRRDFLKLTVFPIAPLVATGTHVPMLMQAGSSKRSKLVINNSPPDLNVPEGSTYQLNPSVEWGKVTVYGNLDIIRGAKYECVSIMKGGAVRLCPADISNQGGY